MKAGNKKNVKENDKILVAEDSPTQALKIEHLLKKHNYETKVVNNGKQALDALAGFKPSIIISDIVMPEMNGYELCRHVKSDETLKEIPVILLTALSDPKDVLTGLESGADNFIIKPYEDDHLLSRIRYFLERKILPESKKGKEIVYDGKKYYIRSKRFQIIDLLLSTYETAISKANDLKQLKDQLEDKVEERTALLMAEVAAHERSEAQLEAKKQKLLEQTKLTSDFLNILEITAVSLNFDEALNKLLPYIKSLLACDHCLVYHVDEQNNMLSPFHNYGLSQDELVYFITSLSKHAECTHYLIGSKGVNFIEDIDQLPGQRSHLCQFLQSIKAKSIIVFPIIYQKKLVEVLICTYLKKKMFAHSSAETADKLRKHIQKAYLAQQHSMSLLTDTMQLAEQLETLKAMTDIDRTILTSTSEKEVIYGALKTFGQAIRSDIIEILEFDSEKNNFNLSAAQEKDRFIAKKKSFGEKDMRCWDNIIFGIPTYYPDLSSQDISENFEKRFTEKRYYSLLVVPLISKGDLIGIMAIGNRKRALYNPQQLSVVQRLGNQVAVALSNTGLIRELKDLVIGVVNSLAAALDAKSAWTVGHSQRVSDLAVETGRKLGLDENRLYNLKLAALFHDVGKIGTYDVVLDKVGKLTDDEFELIKKHPGKTFEILSPIPRMKEIADIAKYHHERWDGRGYPDGLAGEDIPRPSRIITVADTFDAMTSDRPYRKGLSEEQAMQEISRLAGKQFDPEIAEVFVRVIRERQKGSGPGKQKAA